MTTTQQKPDRAALKALDIDPRGCDRLLSAVVDQPELSETIAAAMEQENDVDRFDGRDINDPNWR